MLENSVWLLTASDSFVALILFQFYKKFLLVQFCFNEYRDLYMMNKGLLQWIGNLLSAITLKIKLELKLWHEWLKRFIFENDLKIGDIKIVNFVSIKLEKTKH